MWENFTVYSRLPWPPFLFLFLILFCFTFAFGVLHAPGSFDLGQMEIELDVFVSLAAVPKHRC